MSIFLGLIFAGVAVFIFVSLIVNIVRKNTNKSNRRVKRAKEMNLTESPTEIEKAVAEFKVLDNVVEFTQKPDHAPSFHSDADFYDINVETEEQGKFAYSEKESEKISFGENLITLFVLPENDKIFEGYELYQTLIDEGLLFGDMDIFHFIQNNEDSKCHVFSVAQATEPGIFDLDDFGANTYYGLCFVMNRENTIKGQEQFKTMLEKANNIAKSLNGMLCDDAKQPLEQEEFNSYFDSLFSLEIAQNIY